MSRPHVVDASLIVDRLAGTVRDSNDGPAHAPVHVDVEVLSAIGRLVRAGSMTEERATSLLAKLAESPIHRRELPDLVLDAWDLRHGISLRDAWYAALADRLGIPLLTTDARLAAAYDGAELVRA